CSDILTHSFECCTAKIANHWHRRLLRARRERPRDCRTAERGKQLPPSDGDCHTPSRARCVRERYHATSGQSCLQGEASTSFCGFNCTTPAANSLRTPPSRPRLSGLLVGKSIQPELSLLLGLMPHSIFRNSA